MTQTTTPQEVLALLKQMVASRDISAEQAEGIWAYLGAHRDIVAGQSNASAVIAVVRKAAGV
jgi:hypothetical protein